jgi:inner membrane protein
MAGAFYTTWWVWVAAGFVLGIVEVAVPGYIFLGFAIGAVLTGALLGFGLLGGNIAVLALVFAVASLAAWMAVRQVMGKQAGHVKRWTTDINDN